MATDNMNVRVEERLKIKIGEAKKLQPRNNSSSPLRDVYCTLTLDQEEIFRTSTIHQNLYPFFGEEFQFEVPREFQYLSVYVYDRDRHLKQDKLLGKVAIKREDLAKYIDNKDNWFSICPVDADSEVQGKANIEIQFDSVKNSNNISHASCNSNRRLTVRVIECLDLTLKNGSCDPYANVTVTYTNGKSYTKRTKVRKKTTCPQFSEVFVFDYEESRDRDVVFPESDVEVNDLSVSLWHNGTGGDVFLGEVRRQLRGMQQQNSLPSNAWYSLQPRQSKDKKGISGSTPPGTRLSIDNNLGSLRLQIHYTADNVFPAEVYAPLRTLLLNSVNAQPITSSAVYILGDIISKTEVAQPLVRIFMHHQQLVPLIRALANAEVANTTDPTTIFRGNTLVSKMMDEAMKKIGSQYLHKTLKPTIDQVFMEKKPCEIDPSKIPEDSTNTRAANLANLKNYVQSIFRAITESAAHCPALMCQIFCTLKECAMTYFPDSREIRYSVISGFIFLRFFAPAILGPRLFDLTNEAIDPQTNRTLTLISKTIQSLGNLVSSRSQQKCKEEYMECVYKEFYTDPHKLAMRNFLDKVSANCSIETMPDDIPVTLKEGMMTKRAQGRKRFGRKNFKKRFFKLTTHDLSYSKCRGRNPLCRIPLSNILAVERLQERSFKKKNMFQIVQKERTLYVQAANCVEAKEWIDMLTKICHTNSNRLEKYHPCAFIDGQWLCCSANSEAEPGCCNVSCTDSQNLHMSLDPERDLQRMHSLIILHSTILDKLSKLAEASNGVRQTIKQIIDAARAIQKTHRIYQGTLVGNTKYGSKATPFGDDNYLQASRMTDMSLFVRSRRDD